MAIEQCSVLFKRNVMMAGEGQGLLYYLIKDIV